MKMQIDVIHEHFILFFLSVNTHQIIFSFVTNFFFTVLYLVFRLPYTYYFYLQNPVL